MTYAVAGFAVGVCMLMIAVDRWAWRRTIDALILEYEAAIQALRAQARAVADRADEVALVARVMLWRQQNEIEQFNELVIWELAEELGIERSTASAVYDRLVAHTGEWPPPV